MTRAKHANIGPYLAAMKEHGLKATKARLAVLSCLAASRKPMSPQDILRRIGQQDEVAAPVDQVSIYRILDTFFQIDLVHQVHPGKGYMLCSHHRCHRGMHVLTYCELCEGVDEKEVPFEILGSLIWYLGEVASFKPKDHFFQMAGVCSRCRDKANPSVC